MAIGMLPPVIGEVPVSTGQGSRQAARPLRDAAPPPSDAAPRLQPGGTLPETGVLDAAVAAALGRQDGLAPVFAAAVALAGRPDLPPLLARALQALLDHVVGGEGGPSAGDLERAVMASGLFHESRLAAGLPAADLKAVLVMLKAMLSGMGTPLEPASEADPGRRFAPPPPRRGARPSAQPAAPPPIVPTDMLPSHLAEAVDRALARVFLHQAASLPDGASSGAEEDAAAPRSLVLEIPIAGPAGPSIAGIRIDRDPPGRSGRDGRDEPGEPVFRVELAFSVDPLGPLTARVGLLPKNRVVVGLWCASEDACARLDREVGALSAALAAGGLDVGGVDLHVGLPPDPRPSPYGSPPPHRLDVEL